MSARRRPGSRLRARGVGLLLAASSLATASTARAGRRSRGRSPKESARTAAPSNRVFRSPASPSTRTETPARATRISYRPTTPGAAALHEQRAVRRHAVPPLGTGRRHVRARRQVDHAGRLPAALRAPARRRLRQPGGFGGHAADRERGLPRTGGAVGGAGRPVGAAGPSSRIPRACISTARSRRLSPGRRRTCSPRWR